jgi:glycosyltransferase involved in cell wall biosynthesis
MAAGKPILALTEDGSELARVIDEDAIGWHILPGNKDELTAAIMQIYEGRGGLPEMGKRARTAAVAKYSLGDAVAKYRTELE